MRCEGNVAGWSRLSANRIARIIIVHFIFTTNTMSLKPSSSSMPSAFISHIQSQSRTRLAVYAVIAVFLLFLASSPSSAPRKATRVETSSFASEENDNAMEDDAPRKRHDKGNNNEEGLSAPSLK